VSLIKSRRRLPFDAQFLLHLDSECWIRNAADSRGSPPFDFAQGRLLPHRTRERWGSRIKVLDRKGWASRLLPTLLCGDGEILCRFLLRQFRFDPLG
jgi:hypothetical protein